MVDVLTCARKLKPSLAAALAIAAPASAQLLSRAQCEAINSQCRSDYMARCSSVPPGGEAALRTRS